MSNYVEIKYKSYGDGAYEKRRKSWEEAGV
jgi:hypothetical protein